MFLKQILACENKIISRWQGWKHFFIPHDGNDYKPHSLHPKRLILHALAVLVTKCIVVFAIVFLPMSAWMTPDFLAEEGKGIISLTNQLRQNLDLPVLAESRVLNKGALAKANDMLYGQYFAHVSPTGKGLANWLSEVGYKYTIAGENLAMGFSGAAGVVEGWKNSPTHYDNLADVNFRDIGVGVAVGTYQNRETILVAQFLGTPAQAIILPQSPLDKPSNESAASSIFGQVKGNQAGQGLIAAQPSVIQRYQLVKAEKPPIIGLLFGASFVYYKILLAVVGLSLFLNIFIEIKKQHPHLILSGFCLIFILILAIIF